ncbi:methyltransferase-like protein 7A [Nephila pilipes]|uniref:Methyltransferase-like protein 7A n=1 Tax=Nephila pilipes TaxID=299642 RepID=A0A8X6NK29_NEPPI|nr:methyltransferase-like protein 7A [Nephila pilipes]
MFSSRIFKVVCEISPLPIWLFSGTCSDDQVLKKIYWNPNCTHIINWRGSLNRVPWNFSQSVKKIWFPFFFTFCIFPTLKRQLAPLRRCAFDLLQEHLGQRKKKGPHDILEIGIADGDNLPYYPDNSSLIALDPSEDFEELLKNNLKKHPQIMFKRKVTAMGENMVGVEDASVDVVVSTYVLCSVKDVRSVLKEVKRVLKPGGKFLFLEHVSYPKSEWNFLIQFLAAPVWRIYFGKCTINRNTGEEIQKAGFSNVEQETKYNKNVWLYMRPQIVGVATK